MPEAVTRVFVALGSNLGDREEHVKSAVTEIGGLKSVAQLRVSSLYETDPMGPQNQPDYLNAACSFYYSNTPRVLLAQLQAIESSHGRVKNTEPGRWTWISCFSVAIRLKSRIYRYRTLALLTGPSCCGHYGNLTVRFRFPDWARWMSFARIASNSASGVLNISEPHWQAAPVARVLQYRLRNVHESCGNLLL